MQTAYTPWYPNGELNATGDVQFRMAEVEAIRDITYIPNANIFPRAGPDNAMTIVSFEKQMTVASERADIMAYEEERSKQVRSQLVYLPGRLCTRRLSEKEKSEPNKFYSTKSRELGTEEDTLLI